MLTAPSRGDSNAEKQTHLRSGLCVGVETAANLVALRQLDRFLYKLFAETPRYYSPAALARHALTKIADKRN